MIDTYTRYGIYGNVLYYILFYNYIVSRDPEESEFMTMQLLS